MKIDRSRVIPPRHAKISSSLEKTVQQVQEEAATGHFTPIDSPGQAHFIYWIDVFDQFDEILAAYIEDKRYPEEHVLAVLSQTELILRELVFHPKYYNSVDHENVEIVCQTLRVLYLCNGITEVTFMDTIQALMLRFDAPITLVDLFTADPPPHTMERGCAVCYEVSVSNSVSDNSVSPVEGTDIERRRELIYLPNADKLPNSPQEICDRLMEKHQLPSKVRLQLLHNIQLAQNFPDAKQRRLHALVRLHALAFATSHRMKDVTMDKKCGDQFLKILNHPDISLEDLKQILRCFRSFNDPLVSKFIRKHGCGPHGAVIVALRRLISLIEVSSDSTEKKQAGLVLANLLAVLHSQRSMRRTENFPSSVTELLIHLLSHEDKIVFLLALELLHVEKLSGPLLQRIIRRGLPGLYKQIPRLITRFREWKQSPDESDLLIIDDSFTIDQQVPTSLLEFFAMLKRNGVPTAQFLQNNVAELLLLLLPHASVFHPKLHTAALSFISVIIQEEPENYGLVMEAGLCQAAVDSIASSQQPHLSHFEAFCAVLRNISLKEEGRTLVLEGKVLDTLFSVLSIDSTLTPRGYHGPSECVADTLGEIASYYPQEYATPIASLAIEKGSQLKAKYQSVVEQASPSVIGMENDETVMKSLVDSMITFSTKLYETYALRMNETLFRGDRALEWIEINLSILACSFPKRIGYMNEITKKFFDLLCEMDTKQLLSVMIEKINSFDDSALSSVSTDNKVLIHLCCLMTQLRRVLKHVEGLNDVSEIFHSDNYRRAFVRIMNTYRALAWHDAEQDIRRAVFEHEQKSKMNEDSGKDQEEFHYDWYHNYGDPTKFVQYMAVESGQAVIVTIRELLRSHTRWLVEPPTCSTGDETHKDMISIQYVGSVCSLWNSLIELRDISYNAQILACTVEEGSSVTAFHVLLETSSRLLLSENSPGLQVITRKSEFSDVFMRRVTSVFSLFTYLCCRVIRCQPAGSEQQKKYKKAITEVFQHLWQTRILEGMALPDDLNLLNLCSTLRSSPGPISSLGNLLTLQNAAFAMPGEMDHMDVDDDMELERAITLSLSQISQEQLQDTERPTPVQTSEKNTPPPPPQEFEFVSIYYALLNGDNFQEKKFLDMIEFQKDPSHLSRFAQAELTKEHTPKFLANLLAVLRHRVHESDQMRQLFYREEIHRVVMERVRTCLHGNTPDFDAESKWIASSLLFVDSFCALPAKLDVKPSKIILLRENEMSQAMEICLHLLSHDSLMNHHEVQLATLQLMSRLTASESMIHHFFDRNGLEQLFSLTVGKKQLAPILSEVKSILRHVVEDWSVLQGAMEHEIATLIKARPMKPASFLKVFSPLLVRNKDIFLKATYNCCQLNEDKELVPYACKDNSGNSTRSQSRRLKLENRPNPQFTRIIQFLVQAVSSTPPPPPGSDRKEEENVKLTAHCCTIPLLTDLVSNFQSIAVPIFFQSNSSFQGGGAIIPFMLEHMLVFPNTVFHTSPWVAKDSDSCLLAARFLVTLWETKEGRNRVLEELTQLMKRYGQAFVGGRSPTSSSTKLASTEETCVIYAISELLRILLKLRRSSEHKQILARLCVNHHLSSLLLGVYQGLDLDSTPLLPAVHSVLKAISVVIHLVTKYHRSTPPTRTDAQGGSTPAAMSDTVPSDNEASGLFGMMEGELHGENYEEEALSDSEINELQELDMENMAEEEEDDEVEDDIDDEDDEDDVHTPPRGNTHIRFDTAIDEEDDAWSEGNNPALFISQPRRRTHYVHHQSGSGRRMTTYYQPESRITTAAPLSNLNRSRASSGVPSNLHTIRRHFGFGSIPPFLLDRWDRWTGQGGPTPNMLAHAESFIEELMSLFEAQPPRTSTPSRAPSLEDSTRSLEEMEQSFENNRMGAIRGRRMSTFMSGLISDINNQPRSDAPEDRSTMPPALRLSPSSPSSETPSRSPTLQQTQVFPVPALPVPDAGVSSPAQHTTTTRAEAPTQLPDIDMEVLNQLPPEIRAEILDNRSQMQVLMSRPTPPPGVDEDYFNNLPPEFQAELVAQYRNGGGGGVGGSALNTPAQAPPREPDAPFARPVFRDPVWPAAFRTDGGGIRIRAGRLQDLIDREGLDLTARAAIMARLQGFHPRDFPQLQMRAIHRMRRPPRPDYHGNALMNRNQIDSILRFLYHRCKKISLMKLSRDLCGHPQTRNDLLSAFLLLISAKQNSPSLHVNFPETLQASDRLDYLLQHATLPISESSQFSPLRQPNHPPIGSMGPSILYSIMCTPVVPKFVLVRCLTILFDLATYNPKVMVDFLFNPLPKDHWLHKMLQMSSLQSPDGTVLPISLLFGELSNPFLPHSSHSLSLSLQLIKQLTRQFEKEVEEDVNQSMIRDMLLTGRTSARRWPPDQPQRNSNSSSGTTPLTVPSERRSMEPTSEGKETEETLPICPILSHRVLQLLIGVIRYSSCDSRIMADLIKICQRVSSNPDNSACMRSDLDQLVLMQAEQERKYLEEQTQQLLATPVDSEARSRVFRLSRPSPHSKVLLRSIVCQTKIFKDHWQEEMLPKMNTLWEALYVYLDAIRPLYEVEAQEIKQIELSALASLYNIVEAYFLSHNSLWSGRGALTESQGDPTTQPILFLKSYRTIVNNLLRQMPSLLSDSMSIVTRYPLFLDFDIKRKYFHHALHQASGPESRFSRTSIRVRRQHVFEDSFAQLNKLKAENLRGRLVIHFEGEQGVDAGGLLRDWYQELSRQIFNPNYALFVHSPDGTFQPNKDSNINSRHLAYFQFCGRVIGKAIFDDSQMDVHFTRSFYKHVLDKNVVWRDMEAVDPEFYKNLQWILANDVSPLDLTFSTESNSFGCVTVVDLIEDGGNVPVTEENKNHYVQALAEFKMTTVIRDQIDAFKKGFYELIPASLISMFNELELELLISGLPDIDVHDMRRNTDYKGYTVDSPTIRAFWSVVSHRLSKEERALLLQFVTGSSQVPLEGFSALPGINGTQKFTICRISDTKRLPSAHTCFNQLDLPSYATEEELEKKLLTAIKETTGFGFS